MAAILWLRGVVRASSSGNSRSPNEIKPVQGIIFLGISFISGMIDLALVSTLLVLAVSEPNRVYVTLVFVLQLGLPILFNKLGRLLLFRFAAPRVITTCLVSKSIIVLLMVGASVFVSDMLVVPSLGILVGFYWCFTTWEKSAMFVASSIAERGSSKQHLNARLVSVGAISGVVGNPAGTVLWGLIGEQYAFLIFALIVAFLAVLSKYYLISLVPLSNQVNDERCENKDAPLAERPISNNAYNRLVVVGFWWIVALSACVGLFASMENVAGLYWYQTWLSSEALIGVILGCWALGMVLGAELFEIIPKLVSPFGMLRLGAAGMGVIIVSEAFINQFWLMCGFFVLGGIFNGLHNVALRHSVQESVPAKELGSAWIKVGIAMNVAVGLGMIAGTPYASMDPRVLLWVSGLGILVVVFTSLPFTKSR